MPAALRSNVSDVTPSLRCRYFSTLLVGVFGGTGLEGAVNIISAKEHDAAATPEERAELHASLIAELKHSNTAVESGGQVPLRRGDRSGRYARHPHQDAVVVPEI
jgi:hypothetical protein